MDKTQELALLERAGADGIQQLVVGALIFRKENTGGKQEILLLDRAANDFMGGIEEFPSGKVEPGETLAFAALRELEEETGLHGSPELAYAFSFDYVSGSGKKARQFNFVTAVSDYDVRLNPEEHSGFRFVDVEDLSDTRVTPMVVVLLERYLEGRKKIE